jgi:hypothetical protein
MRGGRQIIFDNRGHCDRCADLPFHSYGSSRIHLSPPATRGNQCSQLLRELDVESGGSPSVYSVVAFSHTPLLGPRVGGALGFMRALFSASYSVQHM